MTRGAARSQVAAGVTSSVPLQQSLYTVKMRSGLALHWTKQSDSNKKSDENPPSSNRAFLNGPTDRRKYGQIDMTKLMVGYTGVLISL